MIGSYNAPSVILCSIEVQLGESCQIKRKVLHLYFQISYL